MLKIRVVLMALICMMLIPVNLLATSTNETTTNTTTSGTSGIESLKDSNIARKDISVTNENYDPSIEVDKSASLDKVNGYVEKKGMDIIKVIQTFCLVLCIGAFIIGLIMTLAGAISHSGIMTKGIIVCIVAAVVFVASQFALPILNEFSNWASTY